MPYPPKLRIASAAEEGPRSDFRGKEGWVKETPEKNPLSLKDQGFLDEPDAPLLLVNGKQDDRHPIEDFYLLLEHGDPKEVRIYPDAGPMGRLPGKSNREVLNLIVRWLERKLA